MQRRLKKRKLKKVKCCEGPGHCARFFFVDKLHFALSWFVSFVCVHIKETKRVQFVLTIEMSSVRNMCPCCEHRPFQHTSTEQDAGGEYPRVPKGAPTRTAPKAFEIKESSDVMPDDSPRSQRNRLFRRRC